MNKPELNRIKEVGKKSIADFIRSETGSVGIKNAATVGSLAAAFGLSQMNSDAYVSETTIVIWWSDGSVTVAI